MIDNFALVITHALLALALWRLVQRDDLDADPEIAAEPPADPEPEAQPRNRLRA